MLSKFGAQFSRKAFISSKTSHKLRCSLTVFFKNPKRKADTQKGSVRFRKRKHPVRARNISKCITMQKQTNMAATITSLTTQWRSATSQYVQVGFESERNKNKNSMLFLSVNVTELCFVFFCQASYER